MTARAIWTPFVYSPGVVRRTASRPISIIRSTSVPAQLQDRTQAGDPDPEGGSGGNPANRRGLHTRDRSLQHDFNSGAAGGVNGIVQSLPPPQAPLLAGSLPPSRFLEDLPPLSLGPQVCLLDTRRKCCRQERGVATAVSWCKGLRGTLPSYFCILDAGFYETHDRNNNCLPRSSVQAPLGEILVLHERYSHLIIPCDVCILIGERNPSNLLSPGGPAWSRPLIPRYQFCALYACIVHSPAHQHGFTRNAPLFASPIPGTLPLCWRRLTIRSTLSVVHYRRR